MLNSVYLYSASYCHLCEVGHALILQLLEEYKLKVNEITDDEHLLARYSLKIPVLQRQDTGAELNWPFDEADIKNIFEMT